MNVFIQKRNVITGSSDWVVENENYDYHQEVARSSFADMLHDTERNQMYEAALKIGIQKMHEKGKKALVLDIGTGTGLLSMMAVRNGADRVIACEAFKPMSECALKIIELNGFKDKIKVIPKRSTELTVGENCDLITKCNILVTEVFDTELIGEGALSTFKHAHEHLLETDCIVIPNSATVYAQIVECPLVYQWNRMNDIEYKNASLKVPESITECSGCAAVHDIQLSQLPLDNVKTLVSPTPIFQFDWSGKTPFIYKKSTIHSLKSECDGEAQAVFMWWDLKMDIDNKIILSCAPYWAHPLSKDNLDVKIPWRDHWMQALYYFPEEMKFSKGEELNLIACHDEYSLWFNVRKDLILEDKDYIDPVCTCGFHLFPRTRIGQINDERKNKVLLDVIEKNAVNSKNILILSNGFYLSLIAPKFNPGKIFIYENNPFSKRIMMDFIKCNAIENVILFEDIDDLINNISEKSIDLVLAEPYFVTSILPWDNLFFYYTIRKIRSLLTNNVKIYPKTASIKAIAVQFDDLHKIRTPLNECEGFKMDDFDKLIEDSSNISDDMVESQPLWEYPCTALSKVEEILNIDFAQNLSGILESKGRFDLQGEQACNGIAIWMDWQHGDEENNVITTGPIVPPSVGGKISWDMSSRQGVCLFETKSVKYLSYSFTLDVNEGIANFEYC